MICYTSIRMRMIWIALAGVLALGFFALTVPAHALDTPPTPSTLTTSYEAYSPDLAAIGQKARYFHADDWHRRMRQDTPTPGDMTGWLSAMGGTVYGIGASITREAGCAAPVLEKEDLAVVLAMWAGESKRRPIRREAKALLRASAIVAQGQTLDADLRGTPDGRGRIVRVLETLRPDPRQGQLKTAMRSAAGQFAKTAGIEQDLLTRTAPGRFTLSPRVTNRLTAYLAQGDRRSGWRKIVPFTKPRHQTDRFTVDMAGMARQAERYYAQKARLCAFVNDTPEPDDALIAKATQYKYLPGDQRDVLRRWSSEMGGLVGRNVFEQMHGLRGTLRPQASGMKGEARILVTVRRDGKILSWQIDEIESRQERFARQVAFLVDRAMPVIRRAPSFPYQADADAVTRAVRLVFD